MDTLYQGLLDDVKHPPPKDDNLSLLMHQVQSQWHDFTLQTASTFLQYSVEELKSLAGDIGKIATQTLASKLQSSDRCLTSRNVNPSSRQKAQESIRKCIAGLELARRDAESKEWLALSQVSLQNQGTKLFPLASNCF